MAGTSRYVVWLAEWAPSHTPASTEAPLLGKHVLVENRCPDCQAHTSARNLSKNMSNFPSQNLQDFKTLLNS